MEYKKSALVSVIIPVYNVEKYLRQCVDSVLTQTYKNIEVILVDDGSLDNCPEICEDYAKQNENVKVIHKENAGLGMARNTGLEYVSGNYVTFLDSDDFWDEDFVQKLISALEENDADTVKTIFRRVNENSEFISEEKIQSEVYSDNVKTSFLPRLIGSDVEKRDSLPMSACCTLYSVDLLKENKILFHSERELISEDIIFNLDYFSIPQKVVLSDYIGYNYRTNQKSLTTTYKEERFDMCKALYFKEKEVLEQKGLWDICKYRLSRQFFVNLRVCLDQIQRSALSEKEKTQKTKKLCNDDFVKDLIKNYPVNKLQFKPRIFLYLVKFQFVRILNIYFSLIK